MKKCLSIGLAVIVASVSAVWIAFSMYFFSRYFLDFAHEFTNLEPSTKFCNISCKVSLNQNIDVSKTFKSIKMDNSSALFVHFQARNVSLKPSDEILDPLNLVWVKHTKAPFLFLNLGFEVYSLGMLSRKVHHISVMIEGDNNTQCLWGMNYTCATHTLATYFINQVTDGKGALCYIRSDFKYHCCEMDIDSGHINCGNSASVTDETFWIFTIIAILMFITLFYFPVLLIYIPHTYKPEFETLSNNSKIDINPLYRFLVQIYKLIGRKIGSRCADVFSYFVVGTVMASLFFASVGFNQHIRKYEIPKMFNAAVKEAWFANSLSNNTIVCLVTVPYYIGILLFCFSLEHTEETDDLRSVLRDFKIDWKVPRSFVRKNLDKIWTKVESMCCVNLDVRIALLLRIALFLILVPPTLCAYPFAIVVYSVYITPLFQILHGFYNHSVRLLDQFNNWKSCRLLVWLYSVYLFVFFPMNFVAIHSLLLLARIIVYGYTGLVVSTDDILPKLALASVLLFYIGSDIVSAKTEYVNLLVKTFEECKKQQDIFKTSLKENNQHFQVLETSIEKCREQLQHITENPEPLNNQYVNAALEELNHQQELILQIAKEQQDIPAADSNQNFLFRYDNEHEPLLSTKLCKNVINNVLPIGVTYHKIVMKTIRLSLFGLLIYYGIVVFGKSKLTELTQALAVLVGTTIPKLVPMFYSNTSTKSRDTVISCKIEKIVRDFIDESRNNRNNLDCGLTKENTHAMEQLPNTSSINDAQQTTQRI